MAENMGEVASAYLAVKTRETTRKLSLSLSSTWSPIWLISLKWLFSHAHRFELLRGLSYRVVRLALRPQ